MVKLLSLRESLPPALLDGAKTCLRTSMMLHRHMSVLVVLYPEYTWTARIFSFPTSHTMAFPWWPSWVLVYDHLSCLLTLFAVMFLDLCAFLSMLELLYVNIKCVLYTGWCYDAPESKATAWSCCSAPNECEYNTLSVLSPSLMNASHFFKLGFYSLGLEII